MVHACKKGYYHDNDDGLSGLYGLDAGFGIWDAGFPYSEIKYLFFWHSWSLVTLGEGETVNGFW